jgi:hypothetical protein
MYTISTQDRTHAQNRNSKDTETNVQAHAQARAGTRGHTLAHADPTRSRVTQPAVYDARKAVGGAPSSPWCLAIQYGRSHVVGSASLRPSPPSRTSKGSAFQRNCRRSLAGSTRTLRPPTLPKRSAPGRSLTSSLCELATGQSRMSSGPVRGVQRISMSQR